MNKKRSGKWISVALVLAVMIGIASFAVTFSSSTASLPIPNVKSNSTVSTVRTFQWSENCAITASAGFTVNVAKCNKHSAVINGSGVVNTPYTITITNMQCFASVKPAPFRVKVEAGSGLLLDLLNTGSSDINNIRIGDPNEWFAKANKCGLTNNTNNFQIRLIILETGNHQFSINLDPV